MPVGQRVIEECWTEEWESTVYHVYGFNNRAAHPGRAPGTLGQGPGRIVRRRTGRERQKCPCTLFSTGLSRSAKETEIRIRNIFSGPKKRPPVLFLALMCLIALSCGDLVSCQVKEAEAPDVSDQPASSQQGYGLLDSEEQALLDALFQAAGAGEGLSIPNFLPSAC